MISCGEAEEFIPLGREYLVNHPKKFCYNSSKRYSNDQGANIANQVDLLKELNTVALNSSRVSCFIFKL